MAKAFIETERLNDLVEALDLGYDALLVNPDAYAKVIQAEPFEGS